MGRIFGVSLGVPHNCCAFPAWLDVGCLEQISSSDLVRLRMLTQLCPKLWSQSKNEHLPTHVSGRGLGDDLVEERVAKAADGRWSTLESGGKTIWHQNAAARFAQSECSNGALFSAWWLWSFGSEKSSELIKDQFNWPKMGAEIKEYVQYCGRYIAHQTPPPPLNKVPSNGPLDLMCTDFLSLEPDQQGFRNVLVVTDHVTHYAQAFLMKYKMASAAAKGLIGKYFVHYGLPAYDSLQSGVWFWVKANPLLLENVGLSGSLKPYLIILKVIHCQRDSLELCSCWGHLIPGRSRNGVRKSVNLWDFRSSWHILASEVESGFGSCLSKNSVMGGVWWLLVSLQEILENCQSTQEEEEAADLTKRRKEYFEDLLNLNVACSNIIVYIFFLIPFSLDEAVRV